ncbi:MAG TPA: hypothetical protein VLH61_05505 [Bacteroidales bacterium]|nr:hypothetical protein [Bacteroidales bacterium]
MKNLLLLTVVLIAVSCGPRNANQDATPVEIAQLVAAPAEFENQQVQVTGVISHFCVHAGDKIMVSPAGCGGQGIIVMLGEHAAQFNAEMVGREITLTGLVTGAVDKAQVCAHAEKAEAACCQAEAPAEGCCKQKTEAEAAAAAAACAHDTVKVKDAAHACADKAKHEKKEKVIIELATFELN